MITSTFGQLLKPIVRTQYIVWVVLTVSVFFHVALAWIIAMNRPDATPIAPEHDPVFWIIAFLLALATTSWRRAALRTNRLRARLVSGRGLPLVTRYLDTEEKKRDFAALKDSEQRIIGLVADGMRIDIVGLALSEAVAVTGLVRSVFAADAQAIVPFAGIALMLNVLLMPRPMGLLRRVMVASESKPPAEPAAD